jgi:hypothetical protein
MGVSMTWRLASASEAGSSHLAVGQPCQDSCLALIESDFALTKTPLLTLFVADGAGTAINGGIGANAAVEAASHYVGNQYSANHQLDLTENLAIHCLQAVRSSIFAIADRNGFQAREYACTFLGVLASPNAILLMQIGDGGIVADLGNGLEMPIKPCTFEYANMTSFVTEENALEMFRIFKKDCLAERIAVFSDGIQRLAINMNSGEPHNPFFNPFFDVLGKASENEEQGLNNELAKFLKSDPVNRRTDDDKTLILAHCIP